MPDKHAVLSASSAHRWLVCTAAPRYEEQFPAETSVYAQEGTLAHSICELMARKRFTPMSKSGYDAELEKLKADPLFLPEMLTTAEFYVNFLTEKANTYDSKPYVALEVVVDYAEWVPEGFGTCDCVMIGGDTLRITDYKHGKGEVVSAVGNPQMRLYALGALRKYRPLYGDAIQNVAMAIVQPRVTEDCSEEVISVKDLLDWGESIKPVAMQAFSGMGTFNPTPQACRFCRGRAVCKARAAVNTALEEFRDCVLPGKPADGVHNALSYEEVGELLTRGAGLVQWYEDLKAFALESLLDGKLVPGFKVVAGRSNRVFKDQPAAFEVLKAAGYDEAVLYERKPLSLSEVEKLVGKKAFADLLGAQVDKPVGKPTLVPESDKREPYSGAKADFAGAVS